MISTSPRGLRILRVEVKPLLGAPSGTKEVLVAGERRSSCHMSRGLGEIQGRGRAGRAAGRTGREDPAGLCQAQGPGAFGGSDEK